MIRIATLLALACSCAPTHVTHPLSDEETAKGTYKIMESITVDLGPIREFMGIAPDDDSVPHTAVKHWGGTAWVAGHRPGESLVLTAGHVCDESKTYDIDPMVTAFVGELPVLEHSYKLINGDGAELPV